MVRIKFDVKFDRTMLENLKIGEFIRGFEILDIADDFIIAKNRNSIKTFSKRNGKCISDNSGVSLFGNIPEDINKEMILSTTDRDEYDKFIEELKKVFKTINSGNLTDNIVLINNKVGGLIDFLKAGGKVYLSNANVRTYKNFGENIELWGNAVKISSEINPRGVWIAPTQTFSKILVTKYYKMVDSEDIRADVLITNPEPEILDLINYD